MHNVQSELAECGCDCYSSGFPGAQPVSMDCQNISLLTQRPYKVSWKA